MTKLIINGTSITIGWMPVLAFILVGLVIFAVVEYCYIRAYKKVMEDSFSGNHGDLRPRLSKLQRHYCPWFQKETARRNMFNSLCAVQASLSLLDGSEAEFLLQMDRVLMEETFSPKQYMMALYYRMKGETEEAQQKYEAFLACDQQEQSLRTVLDFLFAPEHGDVAEEMLEQTLREIRNPGNVFLLERNGLTVKRAVS